jgi:hypothetical protein
MPLHAGTRTPDCTPPAQQAPPLHAPVAQFQPFTLSFPQGSNRGWERFMPFIRRNAAGEIVAVSQSAGDGWTEEVAGDDAALARFLATLKPEASGIGSTDQGFIRVLEDLIDLLIDKGLIALGDLPQDAQEKIALRRQLRRQLRGGS